ncbi:right-handed parallel beta-helix repeat-containing protein [Paenibacillus chibensis]|uniref:right-handed parallel beta-helix repeat-containing protein n=1 Tax=Paenibacillus chibensis TaxID=59846 RepID=UPI000FD70CB4|nr:right-handed parallel beta-helix repeat-containing protein [Paenibacillus chibensis]MEC0369205.1 glycosyl hydrolase family 28-related protein [Paenibacillus chibensis]
MPEINIKQYGAKGDGLTDDSAVFQKAVDSFKTTGGTLIIPDGTYKASFTISTSNIFVQGTGIIKGSINLYGQVSLNDRYAGSGNIRIEGITIAGDKVRNGINCKWFFGVRISNVRFVNCLKAVNFEKVDKTQHCSRFVISENHLIDCNYGLYVDFIQPTDGGEFGVGDVHFSNNMYEARANYQGGFGNVYHIWANGLDGLLCKGNTFFFGHTGAEKSNIYIDGFNWLIVEGNNLFEAPENGITCKNGSNMVITNNNVAWAKKYSIYLSNILCGIVSTNNLSSKIGEDIPNVGVYVEKSPYFLGNISNNNIFFPGLYAIQVKDSSYVNINGNVGRGQFGKAQAVKVDTPTTSIMVGQNSNQFTYFKS